MYDQQARKEYLKAQGHDHRTTAWREDVAAAEFEGVLPAKKYVAGTPHTCTVASAELRFEPHGASPVESQLLFGNTFTVYDCSDDFAWGKAEHDGRVGFVPVSALSAEPRTATHWVSVPFTAVLPAPDRKAAPVMTLCLNSNVQVEAVSTEDDVYVRIGEGKWVFKGDLREIGDWYADPVTPLLPFGGVSSYLWGFRNGTGYDCSGLTQAGWLAAGVRTHHDADRQEEDPNLGTAVAVAADLSNLRKYDQVHWPGHVALMVSDTRAIHAKGSEVRRTVIEPIAAIDAWRHAEYGIGVRTVRRPELRG